MPTRKKKSKPEPASSDSSDGDSDTEFMNEVLSVEPRCWPLALGPGLVEAKALTPAPRLLLEARCFTSIHADAMVAGLEEAVQTGWDLIPLEINAVGGETRAAHKIITAIMSSPVPVLTFTTRHLGSAAVDVFAAGARRVAGPFASFMVHHATDSLADNSTAPEIMQEARHTLRQDRRERAWLSKRCGQPRDHFEEMLHQRGRGHLINLSAQEALRCGLVHEIGAVQVSRKVQLETTVKVVSLERLPASKRRRRK